MMSPEGRSSEALELRRAGDFRRLWTGQALSSLGSTVAGTSIILLLLAETHSPLRTGMAGSAFTAGFLGSHLLAGWLGGRFRRRVLLQACNLVAGCASVVLMASVIFHHLIFVVAIGAALTEGVTSGIFEITEAAAMPCIVSAERLPRALVLNQARGYAARLAGPPLSGVLLALGRIVPFAANTISCIACLLLVQRIRSPLQLSGQEASESLRRVTLSTGWRNVRGIPFVRVSTCFVACSDFLINAATWVVILLAVDTRANPAEVGVVLACGGAGGLAGALGASRLRLRPSALPAFMMTVPLATAAILGLTATTSGVMTGLPYAMIFVAWPLWQGLVNARVVELVPDAERAHTLGVARLLAATPSLIAAPAAGLLVAQAGPRLACLVLAAAMLALGAAAALPAIRRAVVTGLLVGAATVPNVASRACREAEIKDMRPVDCKPARPHLTGDGQ
jgi:MFS family permease